MRKIFYYLFMFIILIFLDILFYRIFPHFLRPNIWLIYIIFSALFLNHTLSTTFGFILGTMLDFIHFTIFGINTLTLTTIGYILGWFNKRVNEYSLNVQMLTLLGSAILYILLYTILALILKIKINFSYMLLTSLNNLIFGLFILKFFIWYHTKYKLI